MRRIAAGWIVLIVMCCGLSYGDVPSLINYNGELADVGGQPVNAVKSIVFEFYNAETAGDLLPLGDGFTETQSVTVTNGVFHVLIGSATTGGVPQNIFDVPDVYLSVKVEGEELTPRQRVASVPYAFRAANAEAMEARLAALEALFAGVSRNGSDITFSGVNVHIDNGVGSTDGAVNGLGNLIVGYNEERGTGNDRSGSHNIVTGSQLNFTSYGGLVAGKTNTISAPYACVSGGFRNTASGESASVSGGNTNTAGNWYSSVSGGSRNTASGVSASISGGDFNTSSSDSSSVCGGFHNQAGGPQASVSGGWYNAAGGFYASVGGGKQRSAAGTYDWRAGGYFQDQ